MPVMLFKQKIERAFAQWLLTRTFDNYFYIKIILDFNMSFNKYICDIFITNYM